LLFVAGQVFEGKDCERFYPGKAWTTSQTVSQPAYIEPEQNGEQAENPAGQPKRLSKKDRLRSPDDYHRRPHAQPFQISPQVARCLISTVRILIEGL
jgi:hypothetical protein